MKTEKSDLLIYATPEYGVPPHFFEKRHDEYSCIFLVSCLDHADKIVYVENSYETLTGYSAEEILKGGLDYWFRLIHPDDLPAVTEKIIQAHHEMFKPGFDKTQLEPQVVEYRFKRPSGQWCRIRDTKYLLFRGNQVAIDKVLCKLECLDNPEGLNVDDVLHQEKSCSKMLEFALVYSNQQDKQPLDDAAPKTAHDAVQPFQQLTKREKEILRLVGQGLSTKMIADKCNISINTVETHRRHLLEKLNVKNSMELIKEASKVYWL